MMRKLLAQFIFKNKCLIFTDKCLFMIEEKKKKRSVGLKRVNQSIADFAKNIEKNDLSKQKIEKLNFTNFFENKMLIVKAIRSGLPYELFEKIKEVTPFTDDEWADFLNLSTKTLHRYKSDPDFKFKPIHSEKIIELAEVTSYGKDVFDSNEQFSNWLNTPSFALGNLKPAELLKDSYGKEMVLGELNRIEHGVFA